MTDKELRKLSRAELVDIIFALQTDYRNLEQEYKELQTEYERKEIIISNAGSIAEAAIQINGVLEAAQAAAEQYIHSVKAASEGAAHIISEAEAKRERIVSEAHEKIMMMDAAAGERADLFWMEVQNKTSEMFHPNKCGNLMLN